MCHGGPGPGTFERLDSLQLFRAFVAWHWMRWIPPPARAMAVSAQIIDPVIAKRFILILLMG
jgi:hypothetical protein